MKQEPPPPPRIRCETCNSTGMILPERFGNEPSVCKVCGGTGYLTPPKKP